MLALGLVSLLLLSGAATAAPLPPAPQRWVTDGVGFLSPATRQRLDERLEAYERGTGHQVVVWIGDTIGNQSLEDWAARTFKDWGIGRKGNDDGVALFILAQDRRMRIEVGYGLEGQLTDLAAAQILRETLTPRLQRGDRDGAVVAAVEQVLGVLGGDGALPAIEPAARPVSKWQLIGMGVLGVFFLLLLITNPRMAAMLLYTLASSGRRGGGGFSGGGSGGFSGGGFSGGGGRSGGGGASGSW